jgi:phosphate transport system substrate-binding protein
VKLRGLRLAGALAVLVGLSWIPARPSGAATDPASLVGGGESWPEYTIRQLENDAATAGALGNLQPVYIAGRGEDAARADVAAGTADFAVSSVPMTSDELATAQQNHVTPAYVPIAAGAVGIVAAVQADHQHGGGLIAGIKLTIPTLAKIFTHQINYWNDPEILAENPDVPDLNHVEVPAILTVVRRDSSSTSSALVAAFLADPTARAAWATYVQGLGQAPDATPDRWPADPNANVTGVTSGSRGMINALLNLDPVSGQPIPGTPAHSIGYVAPEYAEQFGAPLAAIQNLATPPAFVSPTADGAVTAALASGATFDPATRLYTIDYGKVTGAGAYPLPLVSYLLVSTTGQTAAKAGALDGFIRFALGTAGQADVHSTGMVALPPEAVTAGLTVAAQLQHGGSSSTTTTTTTRSTTTTAPTTTTTGATTATTTGGGPATDPSTSPPGAGPGPTSGTGDGSAGPGQDGGAGPSLDGSGAGAGPAGTDGSTALPAVTSAGDPGSAPSLPRTGSGPRWALVTAGGAMMALGHRGSRRKQRRP